MRPIQHCLLGLHNLDVPQFSRSHIETAMKQSKDSLLQQKSCRHSTLPSGKSRPAGVDCKQRLRLACQSATADQRFVFFFFLGSSSLSSAARLLSSLHTGNPTRSQALSLHTSLQCVICGLTDHIHMGDATTHQAQRLSLCLQPYSSPPGCLLLQLVPVLA